MDNNLEIKWQKRNFYVRIVLIGILLYIAGYVMYYHYGYEDPDMQILYSEITNTTITCKQALYYFAENELKIYNTKNRTDTLQRLNISNWNISFISE
jgi:hypothetical protein